MRRFALRRRLPRGNECVWRKRHRPGCGSCGSRRLRGWGRGIWRRARSARPKGGSATRWQTVQQHVVVYGSKKGLQERSRKDAKQNAGGSVAEHQAATAGAVIVKKETSTQTE